MAHEVLRRGSGDGDLSRAVMSRYVNARRVGAVSAVLSLLPPPDRCQPPPTPRSFGRKEETLSPGHLSGSPLCLDKGGDGGCQRRLWNINLAQCLSLPLPACCFLIRVLDLD